ncbi:MAG: hypothetical protein FJW35_03585 [Acidobacteria bacterium]|nr:hypothetical protein [Acidobacteriota bacterium]
MTIDREEIIRGLRSFDALATLRRSGFFAEHGRAVDSILAVPQVFHSTTAAPLLRSFTRIVQWNIEKGIRFDTLLESLREHDVLNRADVLLINEADAGMNRSGNRHVARDLAAALGMNMAYGAAYLELTKGTGAELTTPGENRESLQGNAVLSRHPILEAAAVPLPQCFEPYEFSEQRYGRRCCIWARLRIGGGRELWAGSTHLEVRNTPACRARQMRHLLANLPAGAGEAVILGGDLNTGGFRRGTALRTLASLWRLVGRPPEGVKEELRHPERGSEPLFREARKAGFFWEGLNSDRDTASVPLAGLEDAGSIPRWLASALQRRLARYQGCLRLKLDWLLGRGVQPLRAGEIRDADSGVQSLDPGCVLTERVAEERISDHSPIHADIRLI